MLKYKDLTKNHEYPALFGKYLSILPNLSHWQMGQNLKYCKQYLVPIFLGLMTSFQPMALRFSNRILNNLLPIQPFVWHRFLQNDIFRRSESLAYFS